MEGIEESDGPKGVSGDDKDQITNECRVCHMEGSQERPLFTPCKCRGSIMYVHQDCLSKVSTN